MELMGEIIKSTRTYMGMSQADLADGICAREYIGKIERGQCTPSLDIIMELSEKMNINLFDVYSNIYRNGDISTYEKCNNINHALNIHDISHLSQLIEEYQYLPGFSKGEPLKLLSYARSIIAARNGDYDEAKKIVLDAFSIKEDNLLDLLNSSKILSNTEYTLLLSYGANLGRQGKADEATQLFKAISSKLQIALNNYLPNTRHGRKDFFLNVWASCAYNLFLFSNDKAEELIREIEKVLMFQKENRRTHMLVELSLTLSYLLSKVGRKEEGIQMYKTAESISYLYLNKGDFERFTTFIEKRIDTISL